MLPLCRPSLWFSLCTFSLPRRALRHVRRRRAPAVPALVEAVEPRIMLSAAGDLLFSLGPARALAGVGEVSTADIVRYDLGSADGDPRYEIFFDGDDVGLSGVAIDAFAILSDNELLLSFASNVNLPGVGNVSMSDVVLFTSESLGDETAGTFSLYLDGASVGLDVSSSRHRNIDALSVLENGHLLVSIEGTTTVTTNEGSLAVRDSDVVELAPDSSSPITGGSWTTFLHGTVMGLTTSTEDVDGVHVTAEGRVFVSTVGSFFVNRSDGGGAFGGSSNDVVEFLPDAGSGPGFAIPIFYDGSVRDPALTGANMTAFSLLPGEAGAVNTPPIAEPQDIATNEDHAVNVTLLGDDGDADFEQTLKYVLVAGPAHGTLVGFDSATGTVTYIPDANFHGEDSFMFLVEDDASIDGTGLASEPVTVRILVAAVNDAPVLQVPGQTQVGNTGEAFTIHGIEVSDIDAAEGDGRLVVTLQVQSGTLTVGANGSVEVAGNGTSTLVLTGTAESLNAVLGAGVTYSGRAGFSGTDSLAVSVNDLGNTGAGGPITSSASVDVHVRSVAEQLVILKDTLDDFVDSGLLDQKSAKALASKLKNINPSSPSAGNKLNAFMNQVAALVRSRRLDAGTAEELAGLVDSIQAGLK